MASSPAAEATFISGVGVDGKVAAGTFQAWNSDNPATYSSNDTSTGKWATTTRPLAGSPGGTVTYYFDPASGWTDTQKAMFRAAFALWSAEANIAFVENTGAGDPASQIKIQNTSAGAFGGPGQSYFSGDGSVGATRLKRDVNGTVNVELASFGPLDGTFTSRGGAAWQTVEHEIGHVLGLGHAGPYDATINTATQQYSEYDSRAWSIMSYIDPTDANAKYYSQYPVSGFNWGTSAAPGGGFYKDTATTTMAVDILAIQRLYGANTGGPLSGGQVFGFNTNIDASIRSFFDFTVNTKPVVTLYDSGANNTLDLSGFSQSSTVNLNPGTFSSAGGLTNNLCIAFNTAMNTVICGSGNDTVQGNDNGDSLQGGAGNDAITGGAGNDSLYGGGGSNTLNGGAGIDTAYYLGIRSAYSIVFNAGGTITISGNGQTDTLSNVEFASFNDAMVALGKSVVFDFDGDGKGDILWRSDVGQVAYWSLNGTAQLGGTSIGSFDNSWTILAVADANGDGKADIFWQNDNGQAGVSLAGSSTITAIGSNPGTTWHVSGAGDFDGDGKADILWRNDSGQVAYWSLNGTTQLGGTIVGNFDTAWKIKATADTNADSTADIFWQNDSGQAGVSLAGSSSIVSIGSNPGNSWKVVGAGDFDGDGKADILWRSDAGQVAYWSLNGTSQLGGTIVGNFDTAWKVKTVADTNGDGKADIIWQNDNGQAGVSLAGSTSIVSIGSNPGTTWHVGAGASTNAVVTPTTKVARDFDGDGKADILWRSDAGQVAYWTLNGTSQTGGVLVGTFDTTWKIKATGDANADSKADLIWQNDSGQAGVSLAGSTSITSIGSNPGTSWKVVGAGDFDGDGKADILWRSDAGQVAYWTLNGTSQLGGTLVGSFDTSWKVKAVGDANGDGKADIFWQNDSGQAGLSLSGATSIASIGSNPGTSWHVMAAGDFDGDGKADILWQSDAGQVAYWALNGTAQTGGTLVGSFDTSWQIKAAGDTNADGKADIFWQNTSGQAGVSLSGQTSITSIGSNPGTSWHLVTG